MAYWIEFKSVRVDLGNDVFGWCDYNADARFFESDTMEILVRDFGNHLKDRKLSYMTMDGESNFVFDTADLTVTAVLGSDDTNSMKFILSDSMESDVGRFFRMLKIFIYGE